ncbi:MAG: transglycosylase domain-containing protein [bacterium]|nr:transglycosylase domain-containing protein [bacterium]
MKKFIQFIKNLFIFFCVAIVIGICVSYLLIIISNNLRFDVELDTFAPNVLTRVYDRNGELLGELFAEKRDIVSIDSIPKDLIYAVVSAEDQNFFEHNGFDVTAMLRAIIRDIQAMKFKEGGSTISQQLAKNMTLKTQKRMSRKIKEAFFTVKIEKKYSKMEIIELYLNQVYFGGPAWGVQEAAGYYFGKDAKDLNLAECSMLAGIIRVPAYYDPYKHFEKAKMRQNYVLKRMVEDGYITIEQAEEALKQEIIIKRKPSTPRKAEYFLDYIVKYLIDQYGYAKTFNGGLNVQTTLDLKIQEKAEEALRLANQRRIDEELPEIQGGIIVMDPNTGQILAMVGGLDYETSKWNRAVQAPRQPGSLFKVFLYTAYLDNGRGTLSDLWYDTPIAFPDIKVAIKEEEPDSNTMALSISDTELKSMTPEQLKEWEDAVADSLTDTSSEEIEDQVDFWIPTNYQNFSGIVNIRKAIQSSINLIAIKVTHSIGPELVVSYAYRMGIKSPLKPVMSVSLGSNEVNLLETVSAISCLPTGGWRNEPVAILSITDYKGKEYEKFIKKPKQVLDERTAFLMNYALMGVVQFGSGWRANIPGHQIAGKTGTTNNFTDAWFVGYTPDYICGIFIGNDDPSESLGDQEAGGKVAAPVWKDVMFDFLKDIEDPKKFNVPEDIVFREIDPTTGLLATQESKTKYLEAYIKGTEPTKYSDYSKKEETRSLEDKIELFKIKY